MRLPSTEIEVISGWLRWSRLKENSARQVRDDSSGHVTTTLLADDSTATGPGRTPEASKGASAGSAGCSKKRNHQRRT